MMDFTPITPIIGAGYRAALIHSGPAVTSGFRHRTTAFRVILTRFAPPHFPAYQQNQPYEARGRSPVGSAPGVLPQSVWQVMIGTK
jgi:hypothetical protein